MKKIQKKHLTLPILLTLLAGGVFWLGGDRYNSNEDDIVIPTEFIFQGKTIALAWTDDNAGEDLIIQSDRKEYSGFNEVDVYFSITNTTRQDQEMDVVVWVGSEKVEVKEILKIDRDNNFQFPISNFQSISNDQVSNRKDIKGFTDGYAVNDQIKSGETNFYRAKIKYPPMSEGEFFVEAFGESNSKLAYGHLDPWFSSSWNYRRQIIIDHSEVADVADPSATYADFPVYVHATGLSNVKADGADIRFTSSDGETELPREIEKYDSGTLDAWVKVTLTKDAGDSDDDVIYMYYGNTDATEPAPDSAYGRENVWDDNFVMIQHLQEIPDNTADQIKDSTSNANDGQTFTMASDDQVAGQIDGSLDLDGGSDYVDFGNPDSTLVNDLTINFWCKLGSDFTSIQSIINKYPWDTALGSFFIEFGRTDYKFSFSQNAAATELISDSVIDESEWHYIAFTRSGSTGNWDLTFFTDGTYDNSVNTANNPVSNSSSVLVGSYSGPNYPFEGAIDEVRISNIARSAGWIETEYNNQSDVGSFITIGTEMSNNWYNTNWKYRRQIDINSSQIAITTSDFPILATTTLDDLKTTANGGKVENENGYDIIFVNPLGNTLLNYEREKYASATGEIAYWIKTDISSTTDKKIYMYYGNASATDQSTTTGVWDDNYKGVWHLAETPAGTIYDSTLNNNDGTTSGMDSADQISGQINGSLDFDGEDDYVDIADSPELDDFTQATWSFWTKPEEPNIDHYGFVTKYEALDGHRSWAVMQSSTDAEIDLILSDDGINYDISASAGYNLSNLLVYVVVTYDSGTVNFYKNGSFVSDDSNTELSIYAGTHNVEIGKYRTNEFDGQIDEVRISNIVRSAGWIETEYNNQSNASSFLTINSEQSLKLVITTAAKTLTAGTESTAFTIQVQDLDSYPINMGSDTTINLSSDSSLYSFASTTGGTAISSVTIPSGSNSVDFYYTDHKIGSPTITVTATNLVSDTQQQTVYYQYRRQITINASQIATTTDNFPVLATTTLDDLKTTANGGKVNNDNGYGIFFTDDDGITLLNFEKEKYSPTTGEIVYWIKTDISSTIDKTIYMYYGGSDTDQSNATGVWDDNFVMVQHLQEDPGPGGAGDIIDSTKYNNDGTAEASMTTSDQVVGQIDGSLDFDGGDDYVQANTIEDTGASPTTETFSLWVKRTGSPAAVKGIFQSDSSLSSSIPERYFQMAANYTMRAYNCNTYTSYTTTALGLSEWYYISWVRNGTSNKIYVNSGEEVDTSIATICSLSFFQIANGFGGYFPGLIDEVRISDIARTAGWIETEYNNQSDIGSFMTFGAAEEAFKLDITTSAKILTAGTESTVFTVQANHNVGVDTTINLSSNSSGTYHFAASPGGAEVSSVIIPSGTSSVDFYYTDYEEGSPTIVVAAINFVSDDQQQTVVKIITQLNSPHTDKWTDGLVGYWSFDGQDMDWASSTAEALDTSGNSNHGDVINGAVPVIGKVGQGLEFDGSDDYVDVGDAYNGVKTVNFWIKANSLTEKIIDLNGTADIEVISGTITANNFSNTIYVDGAVSSIIDMDWHHIAIATGTAININAFDIGRISAGYFDGILDEVRIYNRTLSADEIAKQYRVGARKFQIDPSKGYKTIIE